MRSLCGNEVAALLKASNDIGMNVSYGDVKRFSHKSDAYTAHYPYRIEFGNGPDSVDGA